MSDVDKKNPDLAEAFMPGREDMFSNIMQAAKIHAERKANRQELSSLLNPEVKLAGAGDVAKALAKAIKEAKPAVSRIDMSYKDVTKRVPALTEAAKKLQAGELDPLDYDALVRQFKPVEPYAFVPRPATAEEAIGALSKNKAPMYGKTSEIEPGEITDLRLDIPAYSTKGVWVNSIHRKGKPTVYGSVSSVKNATMKGSSGKALKVATGETPKGPFAVISGEWQHLPEEQAVARAQEYLDHPEWAQIGYDPERHGYFYDRRTMEPILGADEIIQIGPLVLGKNPKYGPKADEPFAKGGSATLAAMDTGKVEMRKAPGAKKAEGILSAAAEFLPGVGAAKAAAEGDYPSAALQGALDVAGGPLLKGAAALGGKAIPALAGIFIGPKSKLWNAEKAKQFEDILNATGDPKVAYKRTGTFIGADGRLRQEISDEALRLRTPDELAQMKQDKEVELSRLKSAMGFGIGNRSQRDLFPAELTKARAAAKPRLTELEQDIGALRYDPTGHGLPARLMLEHPELFAAYPEMKDIMVRTGVRDLGPGVHARLELGGGNPRISLADPSLVAKDFSTPEQSLAHEFQHLVQHNEGFEGGSSPQDAFNMVAMHRVRELMNAGASYNEAAKAANAEFKGRAGELYNRMAGEAESRATEARIDMPMQQRLENYPPEQQYRDTYPYEQQLLQRDYGYMPFKAGGEVHMAGAGWVKKAAQAIEKAAGEAKPVTAIKDLTTIQDTHTNLMDSVRDRAEQMRRVMEGFDYKYKPGDYVFFADSVKKNLPPARIVSQHLHGNQPMREPVPPGTPKLAGKLVRDPSTGKVLRTPYEPGYMVRIEHGPEEWSEFTVPETGILGRVEPDEPYKKGGEVHAADGGSQGLPLLFPYREPGFNHEAYKNSLMRRRFGMPDIPAPYRVTPQEITAARAFENAPREEEGTPSKVFGALLEAGKEQGQKEIGSLKDPNAIPDLINRGLIANNPVSGAIDLVNMALEPIGLGSEMPFGGSAHIQKLMKDYGITKQERPMIETGLAFASPFAIPAAEGIGKLAKSAAPAAREALHGALERGMESGLIQGPSYAVKPAGGRWMDRPGNLPMLNIVDRSTDASLTGGERSKALEKWKSSVLNNYVKTQMGTPEDPILKLAEEWPAQKADMLGERRARIAELEAKAKAIEDGPVPPDVRDPAAWKHARVRTIQGQIGDVREDIERINNYEPLHIPFQDVPVFAGTAARREAAGFPRLGTAKSEHGMMWENLTDPQIKSIEAWKLKDPDYLPQVDVAERANITHAFKPAGTERPYPNLQPHQAQEARDWRWEAQNLGQVQEANPWLSKVGDLEPIYSVADYHGTPSRLGFPHLLDVLRSEMNAGKLKPEDLKRVSISDAVKRAAAYNAEKAEKMAKAEAEAAANQTVRRDFGDGFKLVELNQPGQFAKESEIMGHSVEGYEPHRNHLDWVESAKDTGDTRYGLGGWDAIKSGEAQVLSLRNNKNQPKATIHIDRTSDPKIIEIKGPRNKDVGEDYRRNIQKFIRENNYEVTDDLDKVGLIDTKQSMAYQGVPHDLWKLQDKLPADAPRYVTEEELRSFARTGKFEPHFKHGGEVHMAGAGSARDALAKLLRGAKEAPREERLRSYVDPESARIADWRWNPMTDVAEKLGVPEVPDYIQKGFGQFMADQAKRASKGEMGPRDLIKAYTITRSSVNRGSLPHSTATKTGMKLPATSEPVRPEGAFAEWLGSPEGQAYLNAAERGEADPRVLRALQEKFSPFGMPGVLAEDMRWAAENLSRPEIDINAMITGNPERYRELSQSVPGIGPAKSGFMGSMLGRGDFPTLDARQLRLHTQGGGKEASKFMKRGKGEGGEEAVARLAARQGALDMALDPELDPFYQHLVHHAIWDRVGGSETTHEDLIRAMRGYADGGSVRPEVHMAGAGDAAKAAAAAARKIEEAFAGDMTAAGRAAAGRKGAEYIKSQPKVKASEALGQQMEKGFEEVSTTQADRTRVGGGNIGGSAFPVLSRVDPAFANKVWGVMDAGTASRLTNLTTPQTLWTTMLGSATQLKTNPIVFDRLKRNFFKSIKEGKLSPELEAKMNHNAALTFGEGASIRDPKLWKQADTFEKRAALADIMMGQGIPPKKGGVALGGEKSGKGVIFKPTDILKEETEPGLLHPEHGGDVPTFALGPRLFTLEKEFVYRPDLHPGFPTLIKGQDLGYNMEPVPTEVFLPDWHRRFKQANPDRAPGYYDLALGVKGEGLPSQELNDEYIRHLIREGFKKGGPAKKTKKRSKNG